MRLTAFSKRARTVTERQRGRFRNDQSLAVIDDNGRAGAERDVSLGRDCLFGFRRLAWMERLAVI